MVGTNHFRSSVRIKMLLKHPGTNRGKKHKQGNSRKKNQSPAAVDSWQWSPPALVPSKVAHDAHTTTKKTCRSPQDP